ncbi:DUF3592 domain-containing protein [Streptomyces sp. NPDC050610]|uniref:DUF3592 domain-containing protein n=1 Tax=Streptomyces sp. NPDC050610 TaxID=3157097 RepID=UPI0034264197
MLQRNLDGTLIVMAVLFVWVSAIYIPREFLRRRGVRVSGTCVNHSASKDGKVGILMEFNTEDGRRISFNAGYSEFPPVQIGGMADVLYDRRNPRRAQLARNVPANGRTAPIFLACLTLIAAVLAMIRFAA